MLAWPDTFSLRKRKIGSLKVITSVFHPKSSEEQKKVITSADVHFSAQSQVKSKKSCGPPLDMPLDKHLENDSGHVEKTLGICNPQKGLVTPLFE